jgi:hypothetical protein
VVGMRGRVERGAVLVLVRNVVPVWGCVEAMS